METTIACLTPSGTAATGAVAPSILFASAMLTLPSIARPEFAPQRGTPYGMYRDWLYFETPDNYLVCLDSKTGKERWHVEIGDVRLEYFSTPAPVVNIQ